VGGETRFAYFPATTVSDGTGVSVQAAADPTIAQAGGEAPPCFQSHACKSSVRELQFGSLFSFHQASFT